MKDGDVMEKIKRKWGKEEGERKTNIIIQLAHFHYLFQVAFIPNSWVTTKTLN